MYGETNKGMELMKILVPSFIHVFNIYSYNKIYIEHLVYLRHFLDADTSVNKTAKTHDPKDVSCVCMHVAVCECVRVYLGTAVCLGPQGRGFRGGEGDLEAGTRAGLSLPFSPGLQTLPAASAERKL